MSRISREKLRSLFTGFFAMTALAALAEEPNPVPDFSGMWGRNSFAYESPETGLGPVENVQRLPLAIATGRLWLEMRAIQFSRPVQPQSSRTSAIFRKPASDSETQTTSVGQKAHLTYSVFWKHR